MVAGRIDLVIERGEDWSVQIQSLDDHDRAKPLVEPARMDIRDSMGGVIHSLVSDASPDQPLDVIPALSISGDTGLIQLHIPRSITIGFIPGSYKYDLFITVSDDGLYAGLQVSKELEGNVVIKSSETETF